MPRSCKWATARRRSPRHVEPDRLAGRRQRGVRQRQAERLADDLGRGRRAEKLAAAAGRGAGPAAHLRRLLQRDLAVREAGADGLDLARVFAVRRWQGDAAGDEHARQIVHRRQRHHHRRQALVAGGDADNAFARRQRANQSAEYHRGIVAIGQAVHHAGRALSSAVARIGAEAGEGHAAERPQLLGRRLHEQADFPVSGVIAQRDRASRPDCGCRRKC